MNGFTMLIMFVLGCMCGVVFVTGTVSSSKVEQSTTICAANAGVRQLVVGTTNAVTVTCNNGVTFNRVGEK